jgi:hypothetical protein
MENMTWTAGALSAAPFKYYFDTQRVHREHNEKQKLIQIQSFLEDAKTFGLFQEEIFYEKIIKSRYFEMTERLFGMFNNEPVSFDIMVLIFRNVVFNFFADDAMEKDASMIDVVAEQIANWEHVDIAKCDPYAGFFIKFVIRPLSKLTARGHLDDFVVQHLDYVVNGVKESLVEQENEEDFFRVRFADLGLHPMFSLVMMLSKTPGNTSYPVPKEIQHCMIRFVLIQNDVLSFEKETRQGGNPINLVTFLMKRHPQMSFEEIFHLICDKYWQPNLDVMLDYFNNVPPSALLSGFTNLMDGITTWTFETYRYRSNNSPFIEFMNDAKVMKSAVNKHSAS